jgi:hypothetical protein
MDADQWTLFVSGSAAAAGTDVPEWVCGNSFADVERLVVGGADLCADSDST